MNQLIVSLIVIFLPGIIAVVICDKVIAHSKWTSFKYGLYAFVLGISSYLALQLLYYVRDLSSFLLWKDELTFSPLKTWEAFGVEDPSIFLDEVLLGCLVSVPISLCVTFMINRKVLNAFAQKIGVSSKFGDENLFSFYLNSPDTDWIYVRDFRNGLAYQGRILAFAEADLIQEVLLSEVTVFRYEDSAELYSVPKIYLTMGVGDFAIEESLLKE